MQQKQKTKILLDTNFLMLPGQHKIDIFSELERICSFPYDLFIIDKTIHELDKIIQQANTKDKTAAKISKQLIEAKKITVIETQQGITDDIILSLAKLDDYIVATLDKELKRRLKAESIKLITLRKSKFLIFE